MDISIPDYIKEYYFKSIDKNNHLLNSKMKKYANQKIYDYLNTSPYTLQQLGYLISNDLSEIPTCKTCGKELKNFHKGQTFCSIKCMSSSTEIKEIRKSTCLKRYGVSSYTKTQEYLEKAKETNNEKYGVDFSLQCKEIHEKALKTMEKLYGVSNASQSIELQQKKKETAKQHYGVENPFQSDEIKEKIKKTNWEKYGVEYITQSPEIQKIIQNTNNKLYGSNWYICTDNFKKQSKETCLEKYGTEIPIHNQDVKLKQKKNFLKTHYDSNIKNLVTKSITCLTPREEYPLVDMHKYKCNICNTVFETQYTNSQQVCCPNCKNSRQVSNIEKEILEWIKSIYSGTIIENDRTVLNGKELDIYIPEKNLAVEFDGLYWHSTAKKDKHYHQEKTFDCIKQHIRLIHIFEYEWNDKQEICKSIIKSALGIYDKRIYARQCIAKEISFIDYKNFLDLNHLQGSTNSSIRLGLFHNDKLVAVIGFGKSRFKKDEMELHRFCCKLNYSIIGGFSKLIKHSSVNNFITYVDLAHFNGDGYKSLSFKELSITEPNYKWIKGNVTLNRIATQKHKLPKLLENYDAKLSEVENMSLNGYFQIFDSGNLKLECKKSAN